MGGLGAAWQRKPCASAGAPVWPAHWGHRRSSDVGACVGYDPRMLGRGKQALLLIVGTLTLVSFAGATFGRRLYVWHQERRLAGGATGEWVDAIAAILRHGDDRALERLADALTTPGEVSDVRGHVLRRDLIQAAIRDAPADGRKRVLAALVRRSATLSDDFDRARVLGSTVGGIAYDLFGQEEWIVHHRGAVYFYSLGDWSCEMESRVPPIAALAWAEFLHERGLVDDDLASSLGELPVPPPSANAVLGANVYLELEVARVTSLSQAAVAGVLPGDRLRWIDQSLVASEAQLHATIAAFRERGQVLKVGLRQRGSWEEATFFLNPAKSGDPGIYVTPRLLVRTAHPGLSGRAAGLRNWDTILRVDGASVDSLASLERAIFGKPRVDLTIARDGTQLGISVLIDASSKDARR